MRPAWLAGGIRKPPDKVTSKLRPTVEAGRGEGKEGRGLSVIGRAGLNGRRHLRDGCCP